MTSHPSEKYQEFLKMRYINRMKIIYKTESEQDEEVKKSEE